MRQMGIDEVHAEIEAGPEGLRRLVTRDQLVLSRRTGRAFATNEGWHEGRVEHFNPTYKYQV